MESWAASESLHDEAAEEITRSINLPDDITLEILSRLPLKSLVRFKSVCKSWYDLLTHDPSFMRMHLNQSVKAGRYNLLAHDTRRMFCLECFPLQSADDPISLLGAAEIDYPLQSEGFSLRLISKSCNGLFLTYGHKHQQTLAVGFKVSHILYLWNPSTKEHKILPTIIAEAPQRQVVHNRAFGLGYDSIKNDYKVILIMQYRPVANTAAKASLQTRVHCYSLQTDSCRRIQGLPDFVTDGSHCDLSKTGAFVKGAIHWWLPSRDFYRMFAFDVSSDEFKQVPMPDNMKVNKYTKYNFGALENNLCLYQHLDQDNRVDVFIMKVYGAKQSWTKFFSVGLQEELGYECFKPLWVSNTEKHILLRSDSSSCFQHLHLQRKGRNTCVLMFFPRSPYIWMIEPWIESLVSLKQHTNARNE